MVAPSEAVAVGLADHQVHGHERSVSELTRVS